MSASSLMCAHAARYRVFSEQPQYANDTVLYVFREWPDDAHLAQLAKQSGCHETTFLKRCHAGLELRWFARHVEVPLCGHGALAAAAHLSDEMAEGEVWAIRNLPGRLWLAKHDGQPALLMPRLTTPRLSISLPGASFPHTAFDAGRDYLFYTDSRTGFARFNPAEANLTALDKVGVILATPSVEGDINFRFFAPKAGIVEDKASGSVIPALMNLVEAAGRTHYIFTQGGHEAVRIAGDVLGERVAVSGIVKRIEAMK